MSELVPCGSPKCPFCPSEGTLAMREVCLYIRRFTDKVETVSAVETFCTKCGKTLNITPAEPGKYGFVSL